MATETETTPTVKVKLSNNILKMPFLEPAPAGTASIKDFIEALRAFEKKFPGEETNLPLMVTRLRKIFYGVDSWDKILIPKSKSIKRPYETEEVVTSENKLYSDSSGIWVSVKRYDILDGSTWHPVSDNCTCGRREIYHLQEIEQGGHVLDIGHVFAGLDALFNPDKVYNWASYLAGITLESNAEAVTWIGDLASVLGEWYFAANEYSESRPGNLPRSVSLKDGQDILTRMAPARDMLGNVDAFILYDNFFRQAMKVCTVKPILVSDLLEEYYLKPNEILKKRFTLFTKRMKLTYSPGKSAFNEENEWHDFYDQQTANCYAMYYAANTDNSLLIIPQSGLRRMIALKMSGELSRAYTINDVMIRELRNLVKAEL
jgi:hypothetical protein